MNLQDGEDEIQKCKLCDVVQFPNHKNSLQHRFNFALFEWNKYRRGLVKNRNGVEVHVRLVDIINGNAPEYREIPNKGSHVTKATASQASIQTNGFNYLFTIKNIQGSASIFLMKARLLYPNEDFTLDDFDGQLNGRNILELEHGASYSFKVRYKSESVSIGNFKMAVAIELQTEKDFAFTICREMKIIVSDENESVLQEKGKSPFTDRAWRDVNVWRDCTKRVGSVNNYPIPKLHYKYIKLGLTESDSMSMNELQKLSEIREMLEPGYPTKDNYSDFFHYALWCDEMGAELMLQRYNMENVTMKVLANDMLELEVPGLAEKRPSLVRGDLVNVRAHEDHIAYEGIINQVNDTNIWIGGIDEELTGYIASCEEVELDVAFQLGRLPYERMHAAVDHCVSNKMLGCLFPNPELANRIVPVSYQIPDIEFYNRDIVGNEEQKRAVKNILNNTSGVAPYVVFGPPGTGKTVTIVEAICQIKKRVKNSIILVCAPSNAACDMLASKLVQTGNFSTDELIRVASEVVDWSTVPEEIRPYCNRVEKEYTKPTGGELMTYRVVVTTLVLSGRYAARQKFHPDFVFIDEAAQAMEPEALVPIGLLSSGKQLVLAGDPKQLGPNCASSVAERLKLEISLLQRIMASPLYADHNPNFITMLKLNFRAHPVVLQLPNDLFYDSQLEPVSRFALTDPIARVFVYHKFFPPNHSKVIVEGQPVEFCAVFAKERREGRSPSYFNPREIEMVLKYVHQLVNLTETRVGQDDIGIVTPYIRQVYRIKEKLKQNGYPDVEVGTTEVFQGREKRIIIISTVRAQHSLMLHDKRYKLGFVKNEKRFNVALTRAKSKLIVIGCPNVLRYDKKHWLRYIEFCEERNAYFGPRMDRRTDALRMDVIGRMQEVHPGNRYHNNNNGNGQGNRKTNHKSGAKKF